MIPGAGLYFFTLDHVDTWEVLHVLLEISLSSSIIFHCYILSLYSILLSFGYRYYVIAYNTPQIRSVLLVILLSYAPSFFQLVTYISTMDPEDLLKQQISTEFGYDVSRECVSGNLSIFTWKTMFMILHVTIPIPLVYVAIMLLRRGILKKLDTQTTMSQYTHQLHSQLLKTLIYQSCLPIFFAATGVSYFLGHFNILHSPVIEQCSFMIASIAPSLSPLASLYFIEPYRRWMKETLLCRRKADSVHPEAEHTKSASGRYRTRR